MTGADAGSEPGAVAERSASGAARRPGPATLVDVARRAGVSVATASFVLSGRSGGKPSGAPETQQRVRAAAEELGYIPNRNARAMRTGRSDSIVLALGNVEDPWGISLAQQVCLRALPRGLSTLTLADERWFEFLSGSPHDCSFVTSVDFSESAADQVRQLSRGNGGIVAFSERIEPESFDVVCSSAEPAVAQAYDSLRARHDQVSFLTLPGPRLHHRGYGPSRVWAYRDAAAARGEDVSGLIRAPRDHSRREALQECTAWLLGPERPRAVICATAYLALALQAAAARLGISVPEELEIIAIGDVPEESQFLEPVSFYGVRDVFSRIAEIIVHRARVRRDEPGAKHEFTWEFFPGETTRQD
ncbi:LacI family DNA-binding transcriptional regulator [Brachybacterium hainanense]|uniref:LacI family DNA-binding transcriptional regulator n=1 Tax=Brachybacterium hainanense TaxID=1541174 RepID=A0ABV6R6G3_9MICO